MLRAAVILIMILATAKSFSITSHGRTRLFPKINCLLAPLQLFQVAEVDEIKPGDRKIVDTEAGAVIVANVDGKFFAVNAKCPHLGRLMTSLFQTCLLKVNLVNYFFPCRLTDEKGSSRNSYILTCLIDNTPALTGENRERRLWKPHDHLQLPQLSIFPERRILHSVVHRSPWYMIM